MDNQEIFNRVVKYSRTMPKAATGKWGICMYRTPDGLKCFVGCLIPDDLYTPLMEGALVEYKSDAPKSNLRILQDCLIKIGISPSQFAFLAELQSIHDNEDIATWEPSFKAVAEKYNLQVPSKEALNGIN